MLDDLLVQLTVNKQNWQRHSNLTLFHIIRKQLNVYSMMITRFLYYYFIFYFPFSTTLILTEHSLLGFFSKPSRQVLRNRSFGLTKVAKIISEFKCNFNPSKVNSQGKRDQKDM